MVWLTVVGIPDVSLSICSSCVTSPNPIYVCDVMHCMFVLMQECCIAWIFVCIKDWILFFTDNRQILNPCVVCYDIQYLSAYAVCVFVCFSHEGTIYLAYMMSVELCSETVSQAYQLNVSSAGMWLKFLVDVYLQ